MMLKISNLTKRFGGVVALNNINLEVKEGSIFAIIGPNGAGKTTLINLVSGFDRPNYGKIIFNGEDITHYSIQQRVNLGLVRTFQIPQFYSTLTVEENILIPLLTKHGANLAKLKSLQIAERFFLLEDFNKKAEFLPVGKMKLLEIARAYALSPKLLLLDEPFGGLSADRIPELINLIKELRKSGITIVLIEHVIKAVAALADEVFVLNFGEKLAHGLPEEIFNKKEVIDAYLGEDNA